MKRPSLAITVQLVFVLANLCWSSSEATCDSDIYESAIAGIIGKSAKKAVDQHGCPEASMADCRYVHGTDSPGDAITDHCRFTIDDNAVVSPRCVWSEFTESVSFKVHKYRLKAAAKYGCSGSGRIICAPDFSSRWWNCKTESDHNTKTPLPDRGTLPNGPVDQCAEGRILAELAEEFAENVDKHCPQVTAIACPSLKDYNSGSIGTLGPATCRYGWDVSAGTRIPCPKHVKTLATMRAMSELEKASFYGCPVVQPFLCVRSKSPITGGKNGWISCDFLDMPDFHAHPKNVELPPDHLEL